MLWCTAIYTNSSCEPSARLSNPGSASSVWAGLTNAASSSSSKAAKPRNNNMPRFVFYRKKRTLFTKKRFLSHKNENAQHWYYSCLLLHYNCTIIIYDFKLGYEIQSIWYHYGDSQPPAEPWRHTKLVATSSSRGLALSTATSIPTP